MVDGVKKKEKLKYEKIMSDRNYDSSNTCKSTFKSD